MGAPQFYIKEESVGGAVYIYINNNGKNWETVVPVELLGHKESMFGLAVENIGDVNQDGYGGWYISNHLKQRRYLDTLSSSRKIPRTCVLFHEPFFYF